MDKLIVPVSYISKAKQLKKLLEEERREVPSDL